MNEVRTCMKLMESGVYVLFETKCHQSFPKLNQVVYEHKFHQNSPIFWPKLNQSKEDLNASSPV